MEAPISDKKVSQLTSLTTSNPADLLLVIDDPNGTPVSKKMTVKAFFGAVPANTVFSANVTVSGNRARFAANVVNTKITTANTLIITKKAAPSSNNASTATVANIGITGALPVGTIWFSNTHLYIATDTTTIRRVALSTFT